MSALPVGTLRVLENNEERCLLRWKVDAFLKPKNGTFLSSGHFRFGPYTFFIAIDNNKDLFTYTTDGTEVYLKTAVSDSIFPRFSWKLSVEGSDGRILRSAEGVEKTMYSLLLGSPLNIKKELLHPDGSLVIRCEIRHESEDIVADALATLQGMSAPLQHSGADALARDLEKLLSSKEATDSIIRVQGQREFHVHRAILVARTPVFASMFRHRMSESESGVVDIEDCDPDIFQRFLHFVYTGSLVNLRPEEATELYCVADKYQVEQLISLCVRCMIGVLNIKSFCPTISLALQHGEKELTKQATEFFADNVDEIVLTAEWQEFLCKNPIQANELFVKALSKKKSMMEQTPSSEKSSISSRPTNRQSFCDETDARPTVCRSHMLFETVNNHGSTENPWIIAAREMTIKHEKSRKIRCGKKC